jgi:hypothetical protein
VNTHQPGKHHPNEYGEERQAVVLLSDHFVIEAEDVFANEASRRCVLMHRVLCRSFMHVLASKRAT